MTTIDPQSVALQRDPFTRQEVQIEPTTGLLFGLVDGTLYRWLPIGWKIDGPQSMNLVPLVTKREPLRCWVTYYSDDNDKFGSVYDSETKAKRIAKSDGVVVPLIEAAELDRVKAAGEALAKAVKEHLNLHSYANNHPLTHTLAAYRSAYPGEPT